MNGTPEPSPASAAAEALPLEAKVAWLSSPAAYTPAPRRVDCIETHFNYVFLSGAEAYKLKKPMQLYGVDLRSLAARERGCREELRLNLRLAPDTYRGVVPLVLRNGALALGGPGPVADWLVHMRRLDAAEMLDVRLRAGTVRPCELEAVVGHLLLLEPGEAGPPLAVPAGDTGSVARRLEEALREVARPEFGLRASDHTALARALRAAHAELGGLLASRAAKVRDGHGDLRAEHVWLGPPLQIIDALEFDRELRLLDPAEDVAMLAVDTDRLDGDWTRRTLCAAYERLAGDAVPARLWRFYLALRAATRAKVALWHLDDPRHTADPAHWRTRAVEYLRQGTRFLAGG